MNAPGLPSILPLLERLQRPPLRFAAQTTAPIAGEGRRRCARLPFGAFPSWQVPISVNTSFSVATPAFSTGHWGFPVAHDPLSRPGFASRGVVGKWEAAPGTRAVSNLYGARSPRRRRCSCPTAGSADFQARDKASVRARTYGFIPPATPPSALPIRPVPSRLIRCMTRVPVRAMAAL